MQYMSVYKNTGSFAAIVSPTCVRLTGRSPGPAEDSDEYEDDDDPGYVREDIRCQDAFVARELDMSDEDGSTRGADVYHRALAMQGQVRFCQPARQFLPHG